MLPGMPSLPPLNIDSAATSGLQSSGSFYQVSGPGDWVVNFGAPGLGGFGGFGSASSAANIAAGVSPLVIVGVVVVLWLAFKR
jgi:hypothetical protein